MQGTFGNYDISFVLEDCLNRINNRRLNRATAKIIKNAFASAKFIETSYEYQLTDKGSLINYSYIIFSDIENKANTYKAYKDYPIVKHYVIGIIRAIQRETIKKIEVK